MKNFCIFCGDQLVYYHEIAVQCMACSRLHSNFKVLFLYWEEAVHKFTEIRLFNHNFLTVYNTINNIQGLYKGVGNALLYPKLASWEGNVITPPNFETKIKTYLVFL
jgi:hypothetical protein